MSRAARIARGFSGAALATVFAAASHALGGGRVTTVAVVATIVLALPICVALAGRVASLWRLAVAVGASQFLFHWSFWALGAPALASGSAPASESAAGGGAVVSPHAAHLGAFAATFDLAATGAADAAMWIAHGVAAILTIALLHRGEQAALEIFRRLRCALPFTLPQPVAPAPVTRIRQAGTYVPLRSRLCALSAISHRGPPQASALLIQSC